MTICYNKLWKLLIDKNMKKFTKLELHELFIGNIVYIIIFLIIVVFVFKKKNV
jgi:ABC-2 type transport system permease protein